MNTHSTETWLKAASGLVIGFGMMVALAALPATSGPTALLTDVVLWPLDGAQNLTSREVRLYCAISGGLSVGLGVILWLVSSRLFPREPELARTIILAGMSAWYVVDSTGSVIAGAPLNALANAAFLLAFMIPLWRAPGKASGQQTPMKI